jgi:hypothetical protein
MPFSLRDLEQHITLRNAGEVGANPSRLADISLRLWIRRRIVKAATRRCPTYGIPRYVRAHNRF